jgi:ABC-type sugar transport system ATPase subunit
VVDPAARVADSPVEEDRFSVSGLGMRFGNSVVLDDVSCCFARHHVTAVLGPNGAGKSTLLKILAGALRPTSGDIRLFGASYQLGSALAAQQAGVSAIYQEQSLIDDWRVWEHFPNARSSFWLDPAAQRQQALATAAIMGVSFDPQRYVRDLTAVERQFAEIAKSLAVANCRVLLVDEPLVGLDRAARLTVLNCLREAARSGCCVIIVTHDICTILRYSDSVVLLRNGRVQFQKPAALLNERDITGFIARARPPTLLPERSKQLLEIKFRLKRRKHHSLQVESGEVLGIAAHSLSSASELLRSIASVSPVPRVSVVLDGIRLPASIETRCKRGVAYVSRERSTEWLFEQHSIERNLNAACFHALQSRPFMSRARELDNARKLIEKVQIVPPDTAVAACVLSGGNRQKLVLARALSAQPRVLLLDEPFTGVDQETREVNRRVIREHVNAKDGRCALIFSREIEELLAICDRIAVFRKGHPVPEVADAATLSAEALESLVAA